MLDHRPELAGNHRHVSSPSSTYQARIRHESEGDREFSFWCPSNAISFENACDQPGGIETQLDSKVRFGEDVGAPSLPLWESYKGESFKYDHSPLLSRSHHCCGLSPTSRSKAIAESRRELMEMIQDKPESSFELSFQDMVEEQQVLRPVPNETCIDNVCIHNKKNDVQSKSQNKKKKNKSNRPGQILRVESMDSETFLLKMSFPTSLAWMKKARVGNGSKFSSRPSFQEPIKKAGKECGSKKFSLAGDHNRNHMEDSISESTKNCSNSSDKSSYVNRNFSLGCWPFFHFTKSKTKQ